MTMGDTMTISVHPVRASGSGTRAGRPTASSRGSQSGFTVLVVLVLLVIMASFAIGNNVALGHLEQELRLVERRQQERRAAMNPTNAPSSTSSPTLSRGGSKAPVPARTR